MDLVIWLRLHPARSAASCDVRVFGVLDHLT
jgi:hypothetical protein